MTWLLMLGLVLLVNPGWFGVAAMRHGRLADLRSETVDLFYHGFDNYMRVAFPEDEVCVALLLSMRDTHAPPLP